jgi:diguanylate cyclase (GGDEF)-like protein
VSHAKRTAGEPILVLEDDSNNLGMLQAILSGAGHQVVGVQCGQDAINALVNGNFAAAILDIHLPDMSGLDVLRVLHERQLNVPSIVLSGDSSIDSAITALRLAAFDYMRKPADPSQLVALVERAIKTHRDKTHLETIRLGQQPLVSDPTTALGRWEHRALHDPLTGLPNRALLADRLLIAIAASDRSGRPVAVLFVDIDRFKQVNDSCGHAVGDQVLIRAAERLSSAMRASDTIARMGGDEFVAVLPDLDGPHASTAVITKIQTLFAEPLNIGARIMTVSCSIGCAVYPQDGITPAELLEFADRSMYASKRRLTLRPASSMSDNDL